LMDCWSGWGIHPKPINPPPDWFFRQRVVGRSAILCNEIALSTELTRAKEG